jgi:hypothetical protein
VQSTKIYDKLIDDKSKELIKFEEELKKLKLERKNHQQKRGEECEEKITQIKENYENKILKLSDDLEKFREKHKKSKVVKKELREDIERLKKDLESVDSSTKKEIQSYEGKFKELESSHAKEISEMKRREQEFLKSNEELMDTDLYVVYKQIKKKFENKLSELMEFKAKNEKITDENKMFKFNLDNSENIIKKSSLMQVNQKKIIKQLQLELEEKTNLLKESREEFERNFKETSAKFENLLLEKESDLKRIKDILYLKNKENLQLRSLSQMILDQRSEVEMFFIESLEEVKMDIYKRKKEIEKKNKSFPSLSKKYQENIPDHGPSYKIDIRKLAPEDREKVLRILFGKINENYKPKTYKNFDVR